MDISSLTASKLGNGAVGGSNDGTLKQLEKQKEELNSELEEAQEEKENQAKIEELQSRIAVLSMRISLEKVRQQRKNQETAATATPVTPKESAADPDDESMSINLMA